MATVLITGANRGIGLALAKQYASDGAAVIGCCREPAMAEALSALVDASRGRVRIMQLDVAEEASIASLKHTVADQPIDILINNAGVNGTPKPQSAYCIDSENWIRTMRINALAPILVAQACYDNLKLGTEKKLVAISSCMGSTGHDYGAIVESGKHRYAYRASKAALNNGMRGLARDWASEGVLVAILDPGWARTDMAGDDALASPKSISPEESARGLKERIAELTPATSGTFRRFWGETIPW
ncbi:SDR family oxidoreductase [Bradyrhizobium sp. 150]|uniref:SDR family oxidoreductase n=1 Tax=Bradyrhizobium sp. 150 TaxID=2782625 RepID=UPI001FF72D35|nr:SDR family oxidoreductase [Bradyrhizobium sp. 150]MCK1673176.1 SDR family oxidoreductase [Bradyrhizobium sp. 150]